MARDHSPMHVRTVTLGLSLLAAGVFGCSSSESDIASPTTTVARDASPTTTTTPEVPEPAAVPRSERFARLRERPPRVPRVPRQTIRANLAAALAARRPDRPLAPGDLEQLTNKAMQIRVMRARLERMRPALRQTPRAQKMRARLDVLLDEFQTKAGVLVTDVSAILEPPPPTPRRGE